MPPPLWIRGLLILTCTGVSFAHGSNDGQKGMGLIMLILIGTVPTTYALNKAMPASQVADFTKNSERSGANHRGQGAGYNVIGNPRPAVTLYVAQHKLSEGTYPVARRPGSRYRPAGQAIRVAGKCPAGSGQQHPQRHVPDF